MKLKKLVKGLYIEQTPQQFLERLEKGLPVRLYENPPKEKKWERWLGKNIYQ